MIKYDSYKDSGIDYIGLIPSHWEVKRVKDILSNKKYPLKTGPFGSQLKGGDLKENGETVVYSQRNVIDNNFDDFKYFVDKEKENELSAFNVHPNDILISTRGTIGKASKVPQNHKKGILHPCLIALRVNHKLVFDDWVLRYLNDSGIFQKYISKESGATTIEVIYSNTLANFIQIIPSFTEQTTIAQYLDTKTQAIDKKVNILERKIGYYKELRKSIINETVTKGLDKSAVLQVNDLGFETPSTWSKKRLKDVGFLYSGLSGKSGDDFNQDDNPNNKGFIPFTNIANNTYLKKDHLGTVVVFDGEKQNKVKEGDIFFLMSSEGYDDIGKSAVLAENIEDTYLNSFCKGFRIKQKKCNPYFLNYLLLSDYYRQILIIEGKGFTRINLKMEKVNDFEVYLPINLNEQSDIVSYLDHKTQTIDKIVGNIQNQITTLKELRKTLINDVVTGKIKVVE